MSRIAKNPVVIPSGVNVEITEQQIVVSGKLGCLVQDLSSAVTVQREGDQITCAAVNKADRFSRAMSGTLRALIHNMIVGVHQGFEKKLLLVGVGYRAQAQGTNLNLSLGFSHPVVHAMPEGVVVETPSQTEIIVKGANKQLVGQVAAEIREYRSPEPYKGKGVRYADEHVALKETKKK
jgi:large subunit ribosomal protein L6